MKRGGGRHGRSSFWTKAQCEVDEMIVLQNVCRTYTTQSRQNVEALKGIDIEFPEKGLVAIVGRSGCGKTTLLNMLATFDKPTKGQVLVDGLLKDGEVDITEAGEEILDTYRNVFSGFVFQDFNLVDEWTVEENIAIVLEQQKWRGRGKKDIAERIADVLRYVELEGMEKRYVKELSGGQQQRVAVARALIKSPKLLLADEPTGNLDYESGENVMRLLRRISESCLVVMVTHSLDIAVKYSDRIIRMKDGKVEEDLNNTATKSTDVPAVTKERSQVVSCALSFALLFKLALKGLWVKKVRMLIFFAMTIILVGALKILITFRTTDYGKVVAHFLEAEGIEQLYLYQEGTYRNGPYQIGGIRVKDSKGLEMLIKEQFGEDMCHIVLENVYISTPNVKEPYEGRLVIGGEKSSECNLLGEWPNECNEIALSDYAVHMLGLPEDPIGDSVWFGTLELTVSGVIITEWDQYLNIGEGEEFITGGADYETIRKMINMQESVWPRMVVADAFKEYYIESADSLELPAANPNAEMVGSDMNEKTRYQSVEYLGEEDLFCYGRAPRERGEIAISLDFAEKNMMIDIENQLINYEFNYLDLHGEEQKGAFSGYLSMKEFFPQVNIVGIVDVENNHADVFVCRDDFQKLKDAYYGEYFGDAFEVQLTDKTRSDNSIYNELRDQDVEIDYYRISYVESADEEIWLVARFFVALSCIILLLLLLTLIMLFSFNVKDNQKKIGILRALGATERDVSRIYVLEAIITGIGIEVFTVMINLAFFADYNAKLRNVYKAASNVIYHNVWLEVVEFAIIILLLIASVYVPLVFMVQNRPVKLIRSTKN